MEAIQLRQLDPGIMDQLQSQMETFVGDAVADAITAADIPGAVSTSVESAVSTAVNDAVNAALPSAVEDAVEGPIADAVAIEASARSSAIATEVTNRNSAISTAVSTEATARAAGDAAEATARDTAIASAIASEVTNRNAAISSSVSSGIATEVTNRNSAITSAVAAEATARDAAIASAVAGAVRMPRGHILGFTPTWTAASTSVTFSAGEARSSADAASVVSNSTLTLNVANTGANGRRSGLTMTVDTMYPVFVIWGASGTAVFLDDSFTPALPSGYTYYALISAVHTTTGTANNFIEFYHDGVGKEVNLWFPSGPVTGGTTGSVSSATVSVSKVVPSLAVFPGILAKMTVNTTIAGSGNLKNRSGGPNIWESASALLNSISNVFQCPLLSQNVYVASTSLLASVTFTLMGVKMIRGGQ